MHMTIVQIEDYYKLFSVSTDWRFGGIPYLTDREQRYSCEIISDVKVNYFKSKKVQNPDLFLDKLKTKVMPKISLVHQTFSANAPF